MNRPSAIVMLIWRFLGAMLVSAWTTSRTILMHSDAPDRGYARLAYGDLNEAGVMLLAALVTLTPGTSTIDIDTERQELLLHVLDTRDIETVLDELERDFLLPLRNLFGEKR
jgi:multisubunit Na+/H+ antiporter MnhE subunit